MRTELITCHHPPPFQHFWIRHCSPIFGGVEASNTPRSTSRGLGICQLTGNGDVHSQFWVQINTWFSLIPKNSIRQGVQFCTKGAAPNRLVWLHVVKFVQVNCWFCVNFTEAWFSAPQDFRPLKMLHYAFGEREAGCAAVLKILR